MAFGETADLIAALKLKDEFSGPLKKAKSSLDGFDKKLDSTQGRAYKAGQQIGTGILNGAKIATAAVGTLTGLLLLSAKEGQNAQTVQLKFDQAVRNSGKVSAEYTKILDAQTTALSNMTGADDEAIKSVQTMLVTQGLTGEQIRKITPLVLAAATQTGRDMQTVALSVGRAVQGSATSLGRLGIIVPKAAKAQKSAALAALEQQKAQLAVTESLDKSHGALSKSEKALYAQKKAALDAAIGQQKLTDASKKGTKAASGFDTVFNVLNQRFRGVNEALSGQFDTKLKAFNERLQDVRENAGIKLLPVLTRIVDVIATKVVPAFGQFIDAILPDAISGLDSLASFLESGKATEAFSSFLGIARTAAPIIKEAASDTLTIIQTAVGLFQSLPPEIQALAVAGLTINKLTGGLVTNLAGGLISAVLSGFKGVMAVNAGIVNVNGAIGSGTGDAAGAGGAGGALRTAARLVQGVFIVGIAAEAAELIHGVISPGGGLQGRTETNKLLPADQLEWPFGPKNTPDLNLGPLEHILGGDSGFAKLDQAAAATAAALKQLQQPQPEADDQEKRVMGIRSAFTSNPTRNELRTQIGQLKEAQKRATAANAKDIARGIKSLQNRLDNRIAAAAKKAAGDATAIVRAINAGAAAAAVAPIVNVTVPVTNSFNSRVVEANLQRYHSYVPGLNTGPIP
jgi:hypothetical protein